MTVSSGKIINKMIDELQMAKAVDGDLSKVKIHLEKVQILNELLLDEPVSDNVVNEVHRQLTGNPPMQVVRAESNAIEDQESSIFDF